MAEDCLLPGLCEGLLLRKLLLRMEISEAIVDPQRTLIVQVPGGHTRKKSRRYVRIGFDRL